MFAHNVVKCLTTLSTKKQNEIRMSAKDLIPFKKGQSGNPNGRPVGVKNKSTIVKKWLCVNVDFHNPITGQNERMSLEDTIVLSQIIKASKGDTHAFKALMDCAYGNMPQILDEEGQPIAVTAKDVVERLRSILRKD